jgi:hypothetical protein
MIHAGRLTLLAGLTLSAAAARASKPLRDRCRRWLGSTMLPENPRIISDRSSLSSARWCSHRPILPAKRSGAR